MQRRIHLFETRSLGHVQPPLSCLRANLKIRYGLLNMLLQLVEILRLGGAHSHKRMREPWNNMQISQSNVLPRGIWQQYEGLELVHTCREVAVHVSCHFKKLLVLWSGWGFVKLVQDSVLRSFRSIERMGRVGSFLFLQFILTISNKVMPWARFLCLKLIFVTGLKQNQVCVHISRVNESYQLDDEFLFLRVTGCKGGAGGTRTVYVGQDFACVH